MPEQRHARVTFELEVKRPIDDLSDEEVKEQLEKWVKLVKEDWNKYSVSYRFKDTAVDIRNGL